MDARRSVSRYLCGCTDVLRVVPVGGAWDTSRCSRLGGAGVGLPRLSEPTEESPNTGMST
jgi:hypothetical protein